MITYIVDDELYLLHDDSMQYLDVGTNSIQSFNNSFSSKYHYTITCKDFFYMH